MATRASVGSLRSWYPESASICHGPSASPVRNRGTNRPTNCCEMFRSVHSSGIGDAAMTEAGQGVSVIKKTVHDFGEHECPTMAASLAYYTIFSLPPLLV